MGVGILDQSGQPDVFPVIRPGNRGQIGRPAFGPGESYEPSDTTPINNGDQGIPPFATIGLPVERPISMPSPDIGMPVQPQPAQPQPQQPNSGYGQYYQQMRQGIDGLSQVLKELESMSMPGGQYQGGQVQGGMMGSGGK